jgi:hypothetical protein
MSNQISERALGLAEIRQAQPKQDGDDDKTQAEAWHVKLALASQQAPAEAIDNSDGRIQAIE